MDNVSVKAASSDCFMKLFKAFVTISKNPGRLILGNLHPLMDECLKTDIGTTFQFLYYLRDRHEDLGCRDAFVSLFAYAINQFDAYGECRVDPKDYLLEKDDDEKDELMETLFVLVPSFGRYDDLIKIIFLLYGTRAKTIAMNIIAWTLESDLNPKNEFRQSLLGKWLPSINASSATTRSRALSLIELFNTTEIFEREDYKYLPKKFTCETYRKMCSTLRKRLTIVEHNITNKTYSKIDYSSVPALALTKYQKVLQKNDGKRLSTYYRNAKRSIARIKHKYVDIDIIKRTAMLSLKAKNLRIKNELNNAWNDLNLTYQTNRIVCVRCTSSTFVHNFNYRTVDVARTIALRAAEKNTCSYYKNKVFGMFRSVNKKEFLGFRNISDYVTIKGKLNAISAYRRFEFDDIYEALNIIANNARVHNIKPEDFPTEFIVITDESPLENFKNHEIFSAKKYNSLKDVFEYCNYKIPKIYIWDIASNEIDPIIRDDLGITVINGFNLSMEYCINNNKEISPYLRFNSVLYSGRYSPIKDLFDKVIYTAK